MRILITGSPIVKHKSIANKIANQLGLPCILADDLIPLFCEKEGIPVKEFIIHDDNQLDAKFNDYLMNYLSQYSDYICDCEGAGILPLDGLKIFLHKDIFEYKTNVTAMRDKLKKKRSELNSMFGMVPWKTPLYNIYVNTTCKSDDYIVKFIVKLLEDGRDGYYISPALCLPRRVELQTFMRDGRLKVPEVTLRKYEVCDICRTHGAYVLMTDLPRAIAAAKANAMLHCDINLLTCSFVSTTLLSSVEDYGDWACCMGNDAGIALLSLMIARYCVDHDADFESVYTNFTEEGNPVEKLIELGYCN